MGRRVLDFVLSNSGSSQRAGRLTSWSVIGTGLAVVVSGAAAIAPPPAGADVPSSWALASTVIPAASMPMADPEDGEFETVPLPELSTETSTTRMLPSGEHEIDISTVPINYLDEDDNWVPIDTDLVEPTEDSDSPQAPATEYAAENAAASYVASIPADAGDTAARFAVDAAQLPGDEAWVTMKLAGLEGQPALEGDTATFSEFSDASTSDLDGVGAVELQTTGEGLKETIVLEAPPAAAEQPAGEEQQPAPDTEAPDDAPSEAPEDEPQTDGDQAQDDPTAEEPTTDTSYGYDYELEVAAGVTPRLLADGSINFTRDAAPNQAPVFSIPLGNMVDSADSTVIDGVETDGPAYTNAVDYKLVESTDAANSWSLRVLPDLEWLTDPARVYPVMIDPTITRGPAIDCTMMEDVPNSNRCGNAQTFVEVGHLAGGEDRRGIFGFDISGIDPAATIDAANLELWLNVNQTTQGNGAPYVVRRAGKAFNSGVSWNSTGNNGPWVNGGGDPAGSNLGENFLYGTAEDSGWRYFGVKEAVEGWHTGTFVNNGLVLKQKNENITNRLSFLSSSTENPSSRRPNLNITYTPAAAPQGGVRDYWQFEERELTDRITAKANIGNGNLHIEAKDFSVAGVAGWDMGLTRYYNSAQAQTSANSNMGAGWSHSFGGSVRLEFPNGANNRSKINLWGPSGYRVIFNQDGGSASNEYKREEPGIDADLERDPGQNAYILTFFDQTKYRFDLRGQLQSIRDTNQNAIAFGYRSADNLLGSVTDTRGRVAVFSYNAARLVTQVSVRKPDGSDSTPGAEMLRYEYTYTQPSGQLAQLRTSRLTVYNGAAIGNSSSDTTTSDNNVSDGGSIGAVTEYDYSAFGRLLEIRDARETATGSGGVTRFEYDNPTNRVNKIERVNQGAASSTVNFTYLVGAGPNGGTCESEKDNDAKFRTNVNGERTNVEDVTKYCIDNHARVLRTTDANNNKRSSSWTTNSNVDMAAMPGTSSGTAMYDYSYQGEDENPTGAVSPEGSTSGATYGAGSEHNPEAVQGDDSGGELNSWEYDYDDKDRVTEVRSGNDDLNITYNYCWTPEGQIRRVLPGTGFTGDQDCTQAANGAQGDDTVFSYNSKNELLSVNRPAGGDQTFTYDNLSRIRTVADGNGTRTRYCYDALDRVVRADHYDPANVNEQNINCGSNPPSGVQTVRWDYDLAGNLDELGNLTTANKEFEYDDLNRLEEEKPQNPSDRTQYFYDSAGNVVRIEVDSEINAGLEPTLYSYDRLNRVEALDDQRPGSAKITFDYDNQDNRTRTVFPILNSSGQATSNPLIQRRIYDDDSQVRCEYSFRQSSGPNETGCDTVRGNANLITFREYDYRNPDLTDIASTDKDESRTSTKYRLIELGNKQTRFAYDPIKRLKRATTRNGSATTDPLLRQFEYDYSQRSNMTEERTSGSTPSLETGRLQMAFNQGDEICASVRQLDNAPNLDCDPSTTVPGQTTYQHNADGDLLSAIGGGPESLNGLQLDYNLPRQTTSITPPGGGTSATSGTQTYDGVEQDRRTSAGNTSMSYGYAGDLTAQKTSSQPAQLFVRDPAGDLLAMLTRDPNNAGQIRDTDYYLTDDQKSVIGTYDGRGDLSGDGMIRYLYEPYGQIIRSWRHAAAGTVNQDGSESGSLSAPTADTNPFTYVSGYHDRATGLIKFGTRNYMPSVGTWTQPDPMNGKVSDPLSLNRYGYSGCDPTNRSDASGRFSLDFQCALIGGLISPITGLIGFTIGGAAGPVGAGVGAIAGATIPPTFIYGACASSEDTSGGVALDGLEAAALGALTTIGGYYYTTQ